MSHVIIWKRDFIPQELACAVRELDHVTKADIQLPHGRKKKSINVSWAHFKDTDSKVRDPSSYKGQPCF